MAIVKTIKVNVETGKSVKELKKLEKGLDKTGDEAKQTQAEMSTLTGGAGARFSGLIKGIKSVALGFKSLRFAIAASGIGLVLLAIVAISAAFKNTEAGQNKFAKLMGVIGSVTGNLVDVLSSLGEKIIWVFENPKKAINDFIKLLKENVINRFEGLLELVPALGKAMNQMFKLDFAGAAETAANAVAKVALGVDDMTGAIGNASIALKKLAAEIAADAKIAAGIAEQRAKADIIERDLIVSRAQATRDISELRFKAEQRNKFSAAERISFLQKAGAIEDGITAKQIQAAKIRLNAQIEENKLSGSTKEDLNKVAQLKATLISLDTSRLNLQKRLATSIITFQNEEKAANKAAETLRKKNLTDDEKAAEKAAEKAEKAVEKAAETETKRLEKIQEVKDFYFLKGLEREISEIERKAEADILELEALGAHKSLIEAVEQESQNKIDAIIKKASDVKKKEIKKKESEELNSEENILALKEKIGDQALALGKNLAKKGSDLQKTFAIAEVVRQQVKSVSETVSNTVIANSKAVAASPTTGGMPFVALNTASAALGIAGGLSAANKAISNIRSGGSTTGNSGGANRTPSAAPSAPSFNLIEGTEGNQINESINLQNQEPIQAYVVSGDVTTAQNLDDSIISESGL